jgi:hypothetical protein
MRSDNNSNEDSDEEGIEYALKVEDEEGFEEDIKLMEDLFQDFP